MPGAELCKLLVCPTKTYCTMLSVLLPNYMWNTCSECLIHEKEAFQVKFPGLKKWTSAEGNFSSKNTHPKNTDPSLDSHLGATCQQGHSFLNLTVQDICFPALGKPLAFQDLSTEALHKKKKNSHSCLYLRPGAAYGHNSLYLSITHNLLEIMSQNLRQVSLKHKSSSIDFGEMAQNLNYACV